jgi:hypothetical protein
MPVAPGSGLVLALASDQRAFTFEKLRTTEYETMLRARTEYITLAEIPK